MARWTVMAAMVWGTAACGSGENEEIVMPTVFVPTAAPESTAMPTPEPETLLYAEAFREYGL